MHHARPAAQDCVLLFLALAALWPLPPRLVLPAIVGAVGLADLLLLDEPTNHLDIPSQEILQEVLAEFQGTILLVSHDRYLIDALATQIWEIDEAEGMLHTFKGSYSEYRLHRAAEREAEKASGGNSSRAVETPRKPQASAQDRYKRARLAEIEGSIDELETELANLGHRLEKPPKDAAKVQKMGREYVRLQQELEALMDEWGKLHE